MTPGFRFCVPSEGTEAAGVGLYSPFPLRAILRPLVRIYEGVFGFYLKSSEKPARRTLSKMSVLGLARGTRSKLTG